jgi:hypothetical protein
LSKKPGLVPGFVFSGAAGGYFPAVPAALAFDTPMEGLDE